MKMDITVKLGCALAIFGGIMSFVGMVLDLKIENSALAVMGLYMLSAALFFGVAGGLTGHGQWSWNFLMFMGFLTLGVVVAGAIGDYFNIYVAVVQAALAILVIASSSASGTKAWLSEPHVD